MFFAGEEREDQRLRPSLPPWVYKWEPPFCVFSLHGGVGQDTFYFDTFDEAIEHFIRFHMGPLDGREASIIDNNLQIVLAYTAYRPDHETIWLGTAQGFEEFAKHHDPPSVAIWETMALAGQAPPDTIPQDVVPTEVEE